MINKLFRVTANKKSLTIAAIISFFDIFILGFFFYLSLRRYLNPAGYSNWIYSYGYGLYARNFAIILGVLIILIIILFSIIITKDKANTVVSTALIIPILIFSVIGFAVISIKEGRSMASYTTNIEHYEVYDEYVDEKIMLLSELLPEKEDITQYEYFLYRRSSLWGSRQMFSMFLKTSYNESLHQDITNSDNWSKYDGFISGYDCYEYDMRKINYASEDIVDNFYILINVSENEIIYAATNRNTNIFHPDNEFYIEDFISGDRNNPYYNVKKK